jgi:hypothetical protein
MRKTENVSDHGMRRRHSIARLMMLILTFFFWSGSAVAYLRENQVFFVVMANLGMYGIICISMMGTEYRLRNILMDIRADLNARDSQELVSSKTPDNPLGTEAEDDDRPDR